jgi:polyisoprenoid-binding protein YceI
MNTRQQTTGYAPRDNTRATKGGELERWDIDPTASRLRFVLRHLVLHQLKGELQSWGGTVYLDRSQPTLSSVHAWVDLASVDTGSPERDDHIRSAELLDVARLQRAEFDSTSIEVREGRTIVHGLLRFHGVMHDLDLEVETPSGATDPARTTYAVKATFDRQSFGLHWNQDLDVGGVVVGDEVQVSAEVKIVHTNGDRPSRL